jgi:hypothetical protein
MSKRNHRGSTEKTAHHVRLYEWFQQSAAWCSLNPVARCVYLELKRRYVGTNNGRIPLSVREAAEALRVGKSTAAEALKTLETRGFIVAMCQGKFDRKTRHSTEWRLTEERCSVTLKPASKEFMRWTAAAAEEKNRYLRPDRTVPEAGPIGTSGRTMNPEKRLYGT